MWVAWLCLRYIFVDVDKNKDKVTSYQSEETTQGPKGKGIYQSHQSHLAEVEVGGQASRQADTQASRQAGKQASRRAGDDSSIDSNSILCPAPEEPQKVAGPPCATVDCRASLDPCARDSDNSYLTDHQLSSSAAQPVLCPASPNSQSPILNPHLGTLQNAKQTSENRSEGEESGYYMSLPIRWRNQCEKTDKARRRSYSLALAQSQGRHIVSFIRAVVDRQAKKKAITFRRIRSEGRRIMMSCWLPRRCTSRR